MPSFIDSYWFLAISIVLSVILSVTGLVIVRRYVPHAELISHHDVAGPFLSIVGTLYAVVLGFIVVSSLNLFNAARANVEYEANALHDIFHLAGALPGTQGSALRELCVRYADCMVNEEWQSMLNGLASRNGHAITGFLWSAATGFQPANARQENIHASILTQMSRLGDCRHTRLLCSAPSYDRIVWGVLLIGAVVLIVFTYFFGIEKLSTQIFMTALVSIVLSLNLVLIAMFSYPFSGDVHVQPDAFKQDLANFQEESPEKS